jgi:hypothetical protein
MRRAVEVLSGGDSAVTSDIREVRALKNGATAAGYFDDPEALAREAQKLDGQGFTVYVTANPVEPALLARAENRIKRPLRETTSDRDILRRRWLPVDFDPVRPAGVSATEEEKATALWRAREVRDHLREAGWPEPVVGDSGNGAHLLYPMDLPNDAESLELVRGVLEALSFRFSDGRVSVDTTTANAARIWKLYGTAARKGDSTEDRPHRVSKLLKVPEHRTEVSRSQLQAVKSSKPEAPKRAKIGRHSETGGYGEFDLAAWIEEHGLLVKREGPWQQGYRYILEECPWQGHTDNACYIVQGAGGWIAAGCQHDSCQDRGWRELRKHYEPEACEYGRYERNGRAGGPESAEEAPEGGWGIFLSEVKPERVEWFWDGRIPLGKITLIDGDPGTGKSAATTDLAARVSVGKPWPDGSECRAGGVVILSAEDGLADTIRPRFDAAGGDPALAVALSTVPDAEGNERQLSIPDDLAVVEAEIERVGAVLVVVDPLMAFLPGDVNSHRDQDVRRALAPVSRLAERTGAAVVVVRHLTKADKGNPLYRGGGSIAIVGAARSGLLVAKHPEDDGRRVLASIKSNLAAPAPSLVFGLEPVENGAVRVDWKGESTLNAAALLSAPTDHEERSAAQEAQDFLRDALSSGPEPVANLRKQAGEAGISWRTVERAKASLGVRAAREGEAGKRGGGAWVWALPTIKTAKPIAWRPKSEEASERGEKTAYLSQKRDEGLRPPSLEEVKVAKALGGLNRPLSEDLKPRQTATLSELADRRAGTLSAEAVASETRRSKSGPALALKAYLEKPSAQRLEWLTKAVLTAQGADTAGWEAHAAAVKEAAEDPANHPLDCECEACL